MLRLVNHLTGDETEDEKSAIQKELAIRPELKEEYEKLRKISIAFKAHNIRNTIKEVHTQHEKEKGFLSFFKINRYVFLAACIFAIVATIGVIKYQKNSLNYTALYNQYYTEPDMMLNSIFSEKDTQLFKQGIEALKKNELPQAIALLKESKYPMASWYLALGYVRNGDQQKATEILQEITQDKANLFNKKAGVLLEELEK